MQHRAVHSTRGRDATSAITRHPPRPARRNHGKRCAGDGLDRSRPGKGGGLDLPGAPDTRHRSLPARRSDRRHGAAAGRAARRKPRPAGDHRQSRRRQRRHRRRHGQAGPAGRLHAVLRHHHGADDAAGAVEQAALRSAARFRADHADVVESVHHRRASVDGRLVRRVRRTGARAAGTDHLRIGGHGRRRCCGSPRSST